MFLLKNKLPLSCLYTDISWFILFLGIGIFAYILPVTAYFTAVPGDLGDARFNSVILEHLYLWVINKDIELWNPQFFYPFEGVLAFSDNHLGTALPYILLRTLGFSREIAFDGWFFIGNCLNFFAAYYVLRKFGFSAFSSSAGAFVFAFALPALVKEGHAQLLYRFAIPLAFLTFHELILSRRLTTIWKVAFWLVLQFFCSIYLGIFLLYLLLATLLSFLVLEREGHLFSNLTKSLKKELPWSLISASLALALCVAAFSWLMLHYLQVSKDYGFERSYSEIASMLPRLSSYLIADSSELSSWIGRFVGGIPMRHEHNLFFGLGVWLLVISGLFAIAQKQHFEQLGKLQVCSLLILIIMTLSIYNISLYWFLAQLPGLNAVRAVSRIVLVMLLPIGFLVAIGSEYILSFCKQSKSVKVLAGMLIMILIGAETISYAPHNTPIAQWQTRQKNLQKLLPESIPEDSILFINSKLNAPFYLVELDGMILSQDMGLPTLNGYSGNFPPGYKFPYPCNKYQERLYGYSSHRNIDKNSMDLLSNKVIHLKLSPCN